MIRLAKALCAVALLAACTSTPPEGEPTSARAAQARFDAICAGRPESGILVRALRDISGDTAVEPVEPRDFLDRIPWHLRPAPPGAASALRGGGRRWSGGGWFGGSVVQAVAYFDRDGRVLGCRSTLLHDGP